MDKRNQKSTPRVSIVMAAKNTAPYLHACLDSVINQTYKNWELIVVNDHSTDATPDIIADYAQRDERILLYHSPGQLLIPALQEGYRHVSGQLINRMDSDDIMPEYKLQVLVDQWQKHGKGTVVAGGTKHFVDEGEVGGGFRRYEKWLNNVARHNRHLEEIYTECVIPSHSWIVHRDDFDKVGAFDPEVYPEDYDLCFRFYKHRLNIVGIGKVLHYWRDRSNRISRTWKCYEDNRYFELKLRYFYELDRQPGRPLVLWGAGRNGKDLARLLLERERTIVWVCDNPKKIGRDVYGVVMKSCRTITERGRPQIVVAVASDTEKAKIRSQLASWGKEPRDDFWFFL
jgi:glycosyltransferase involved in cell wall biosynthesis